MNDDEMSNNDTLIIETAKVQDADLATKDISMSVIAEAKQVEAHLFSVVANGLYDPYIYVNIEDIQEVFTCQNEYYDESYEEALNIIAKNQSIEALDQDAWFFVFIKAYNEVKCVYANNPLKHEFIRIDNHPDYRKIKVESQIIKALDHYQVCALYIFKEADHCLITGKWGTGKTLISTAHALEDTENGCNKIFITRPPVGINTKYDIGFLPGDKEEKMSGWFAGFMSALYYIYANTRNQQCDKDGSTFKYDIVKDRIFKERFDTVPINAVQGMALLEGDIMIVDELQLVDIDYLSMILSRANKGSKLILLGDLAQTYNVVRPSESGLLKLLRMLPHKSLAYVNLKNSYRSDLIKLADKLQDKTLV